MKYWGRGYWVILMPAVLTNTTAGWALLVPCGQPDTSTIGMSTMLKSTQTHSSPGSLVFSVHTRKEGKGNLVSDVMSYIGS